MSDTKTKSVVTLTSWHGSYHVYLDGAYLTETASWVPPRVLEALGFAVEPVLEIPTSADSERFLSFDSRTRYWAPPADLATLRDQLKAYADYQRREKIGRLREELAALLKEEGEAP